MKTETMSTASLVPGTLVTVKVAAATLAISKATFWNRFAKTGLVPPIKFGLRCTRFRADDLLALVNPVDNA